MEDSRPPLSIEAQTAISMTAAAAVAAALGLAMFFAGGGAPVLITSMLIAALTAAFALMSWRHALRDGWRMRGDDDGSDDGPRGGGSQDEPSKPEGPGGGMCIDWDEFTSDFWDHVRSREAVPV
ncbi:MAG TPA: hypothetical protein VGH24_12635 [Solirubrobacteraceae bacterium]